MSTTDWTVRRDAYGPSPASVYRVNPSMSIVKHHLTIDPSKSVSPIRVSGAIPAKLPDPIASKTHPKHGGDGEVATLYFVGTATMVIEWEGMRVLTDPNFIRQNEQVHLGPGVTATRRTQPALDMEDLPRIDLVLLTHYRGDHFDQTVERNLRRDIPIVTTTHAKEQLQTKKEDGDKFDNVYDVDFFEDVIVDIATQNQDRSPAIKITGTPGKHVPPGPLKTINDLIGAIPPTNGWMLEFGYKPSQNSPASEFKSSFRTYISGDTLMVDELKEIAERYAGRKIDLMLPHLGGTTIPSPSIPLLMVTMDGESDVQLMNLIKPEVTVPIHYDDYDVFLSPLGDFQKAVQAAGQENQVVYLDRGEEYRFAVKREGH